MLQWWIAAVQRERQTPLDRSSNVAMSTTASTSQHSPTGRQRRDVLGAVWLWKAGKIEVCDAEGMNRDGRKEENRTFEGRMMELRGYESWKDWKSWNY